MLAGGFGKEVSMGGYKWIMENYCFIVRVSLSNDESFWQ